MENTPYITADAIKPFPCEIIMKLLAKIACYRTVLLNHCWQWLGTIGLKFLQKMKYPHLKSRNKASTVLLGGWVEDQRLDAGNRNYHRFHFLTLLELSSPSLTSFSFLLSLPDPPGCQTWCWSRWRRTWTPVRARTHSTFSPGGRWLHVCQNLTMHEKEEQENHEITLPGRPPSLCRSNKASSLRIQRCRGLLRKEELEAWKPGTQWDLVIFCGFPGEAEAIMAKALLRDGNLWLGHLFGELFTLLSKLFP